ncbi:hypothetical protein [Oceanobacillus sp. J11TS1]|uniref:hypothetical protein n=1 Tax=Oceanobacillus sp. J11TS1 TaxID=2807191 RepID=UPI001B222301|nr:hypothetical protein [Oceanobacillus sp. J11TS1]GIO22094.1 hypothetical protein J11TS1_06750 [Oceanobacillus sp. J11TS1]
MTDGSRSVVPGNPSLGWSYEELTRDDTDLTSSRYSSDIQAHPSLDVGIFNI